MKTQLVFWLTSISAGLAAAALLQVYWPELLRSAPPPTPILQLDYRQSRPADEQPFSFAAAVAESSPSVVSIFTATKKLTSNKFNKNPKAPDTNLGSGVIVSSQGHILTNYHVIANADAIAIALQDGRTTENVSLIGTDPETDLAVLQIRLDQLHPIKLSLANSTRVGDTVMAIGNPYGVGQTVTMGIVSAIGRSGLGISDYEDFIQTDAAINQGNSGGALINARGDLVGISSAMLSRYGGNEGIAFAIPQELAIWVLNEIVDHGRVVRGWLGIEAADLSERNDSKDTLVPVEGVLITGLLDNGPAAKAGLQVHDILLQLNDQKIRNTRTAMKVMASQTPGQPVRLIVRRQGSLQELKVLTGERPARKP